MFSNDWATRKGRKTGNVTLNTDKFVRKEEVLSLRENLHASFPPHFPLSFEANKRKLTYSTLIWGNGNYIIYFGSTVIHFRYGIR